MASSSYISLDILPAVSPFLQPKRDADLPGAASNPSNVKEVHLPDTENIFLYMILLYVIVCS
jgi:hypothetical protein